ncbi:ATP synthase F0 subunit C [Candidatus Peregrinibacteria bacterium RIFOXYB2_FULL_32_7]|nr:MAG: ATP synthase F0 subunit C [Candidatus Peregrinibacteria bacterium RIFOXYB2_FULL_32_7]
MEIAVVKALAAGICMAIGTIAPAFGEAMIASKGLESMARNPQVADKLFTSMLVAMALVEAIAIYALVVSLIVLFVL